MYKTGLQNHFSKVVLKYTNYVAQRDKVLTQTPGTQVGLMGWRGTGVSQEKIDVSNQP